MQVCYVAAFKDMETESRDELIAEYFNKDWRYKEIVEALEINHDITISMRQMKTILARMGLFRRKNRSDIGDVIVFIADKLKKSGQQHGYRFMHSLCKLSGYSVSRSLVYEIMKELDPEGIALRKRKRLIRRRYYGQGPNKIWHVDSYDKLKPYVIAVNGCIDGFS